MRVGDRRLTGFLKPGWVLKHPEASPNLRSAAEITRGVSRGCGSQVLRRSPIGLCLCAAEFSPLVPLVHCGPVFSLRLR